jgi:hypothetical protein
MKSPLSSVRVPPPQNLRSLFVWTGAKDRVLVKGENHPVGFLFLTSLVCPLAISLRLTAHIGLGSSQTPAFILIS